MPGTFERAPYLLVPIAGKLPPRLQDRFNEDILAKYDIWYVRQDSGQGGVGDYMVKTNDVADDENGREEDKGRVRQGQGGGRSTAANRGPTKYGFRFMQIQMALQGAGIN